MQEHLLGEVTDSLDVRRHFAHDTSVLQLAPAVVAYPRNETDVRKSVRFAWQLAERAKVIPVTARGGGTGTTGSAIGSGIILVFTTHMNQVEQLLPKKRSLVVQPGITYAVLEQMLKSHGLFLAPCPVLPNYATVGGAIACNAVGDKSVKYGAAGESVQSLRVVLSNGEVIETGPLNKKELSNKLGLQSLEGEIYRELDKLIEENTELIDRGREAIKARFNSSGYNLFDIKKKNEFNLTPLLTGSEGTLGIIAEATLDIKDHNPQTSQALISMDNLDDLYEVLLRILVLKPSMLDMINREAIQLVLALSPNQLKGLVSRPQAAIHLFTEFDTPKEADQKKVIKQLRKIAEKAGAWYEIAGDAQSKERLLKLHKSVATILIQPQGQTRTVPIAEDICVPLDKLVEFLGIAEGVYEEIGLRPAMWGSAGSGVIRMQPALDLGQTGDRQKLFKLQGSLYHAAVRLGGSISGGDGDGRIRSPYISLQYGEELYQLMLRVKKIFDPYGILNPGVKTATPDEIKKILRSGYDIARFTNHPPRS